MAQVLKQHEHVVFDPSCKAHKVVLTRFLTEGKWPDNTRFALEGDHQVVPTMCLLKLVKHQLTKEKIWPPEKPVVV